ncbi:hypothetical protein Dimus_005046 [Dionaea muscipula]
MEQTIAVKSKPLERKRKKQKRQESPDNSDANHEAVQNSCSAERNSSVITCIERDEEVSQSSTSLPLDMKLGKMPSSSYDKQNIRVDDTPDAAGPECSNNASGVPQSDPIRLCASSEICVMHSEANEHDSALVVNSTTDGSWITYGRKRKRCKELKIYHRKCKKQPKCSLNPTKEAISSIDVSQTILEGNTSMSCPDAAPLLTRGNYENVMNVAVEDQSLKSEPVADFKNEHIEETNDSTESNAHTPFSGSCPAGNGLGESTSWSKKDELSDNASLIDKCCMNLEEKIVEFSAVSIDNATIAASDENKLSLQMSNSSLMTTVTSRKKLLILDLNGLLVDIVVSFSEKFTPDTTISGKGVFKRPFCDQFLKFCFERFDVGVWSSRTRKNVEMVVSFLMGSCKEKLLFCWDQSHCTETGYYTIQNKNKPLVLKELKKLWSKQVPDLPWEMGDYNESNTLLLDDSPYKALRNPPYTAIFPYPYEYQDIKDKSLGPGGNLRVYLERLVAADNVQAFVKEFPFGQRPITKTNLSWAFYAKIIGADEEDEQQSDTVKPSVSVQLRSWHGAWNTWSSHHRNRSSCHHRNRSS